MKKHFIIELITINIVSIPFLYLLSIWKELPEKVSIQYGFHDAVNNNSEKFELIFIPLLLPVLFYIIFKLIPLIDPKKSIKSDKDYKELTLVIASFMSALALFILYKSKYRVLYNFNEIMLFIGVLYVIIGYYFKKIRPNYFIGIRTPWTLESETVWKMTHDFGSKTWIIGGVFLIISNFIIKEEGLGIQLFSVTSILLCAIPVFFSYFNFKNSIIDNDKSLNN